MSFTLTQIAARFCLPEEQVFRAANEMNLEAAEKVCGIQHFSLSQAWKINEYLTRREDDKNDSHI